MIKSEELKASSIAFPALGTGNLCYPADVAAEVMIKAVADHIDKNLTTTTIKMVKMVIYTDTDYQQFCHTLSEVSKTITVTSSVKTTSTTATVLTATPAIVPSPKPSPVSSYHPHIAESQSVGNVTIEIIVGDITDDDSDVIVNPTNDRMDLTGSAVSTAILKKAGPDLQKKGDSITSQGYRLHPDKACCTPAVGNLRCKNVYHILVCGTDIAKAVTVCLEEAEANHLSSVAFPAIGTGALGNSLSTAAQNMCESVVTFGQHNPTSVNRIRVIVFQHDMVQDFIHQLTLCHVQAANVVKKKSVSQSPRPIKRAINRVASILHKPKSPSLSRHSASHISNSVPAQPVTKKSVLVLQVFSDDRKKIEKAEKRLQQLMEDQLYKDMVEDRLINKLSHKEKEDIKHKAKIRKIDIKIDIGKLQPNIQLRGDKDDIAELKKEIAEILKERGVKVSKNEKLQSLIAKVQWQWCNKSGVYENYDINANYAIEQAYQASTANKFVYKNQQSVTEDASNDDGTDSTVLSEEFDFQQMKATDLSDPSVQYDIKRIEFDHSECAYMRTQVHTNTYT